MKKEFDSPLTPYRALKKAEKFFEIKVRNSEIREMPLSKKEVQMMEVGVSGGFMELYWMRIQTQKRETGAKIIIESHIGLKQLSFVAIFCFALAGSFLYFAISRPGFFTIFMPSLLITLGILSIIVPIIRIKATEKNLKEALSTTEDLEEPASSPAVRF